MAEDGHYLDEAVEDALGGWGDHKEEERIKEITDGYKAKKIYRAEEYRTENGFSSYGMTFVSKDIEEYIDSKKTSGSGNSDMKDGIKMLFVMGRNELGERQMDEEEENRREMEEETLSPNVGRMVSIMKNCGKAGGNENEIVEVKPVRNGIEEMEGSASVENPKRKRGRPKKETEDPVEVRRVDLSNRMVSE